MQFERVTYQRVFNLGNYESVRIGADVLINPGEDAKQALNEAKEFVEQWRKENNAYHFADTTPDIPIIPKKEEAITVKEHQETLSMADQISSCTDKKTLLTYDFFLNKHPEYKLNHSLRELYNNKLKELT